MSDRGDTETSHVYLAFVNGQWPEQPTKLLGVYCSEADAEAVAKSAGEDWYNWFVLERELLTDTDDRQVKSL
jgi:hypothetical protein